ncbi:SET and MYND domain-containing protein 4-like protein [Leptotrombidium deliense]|uniref:SET and MYND domain-containing protein 4-like protein n=1 Tax=Leptotrombidium deliense TaxID=299467 RepID=A0A443SW55_9ACAR|nr:SET and MYND domain-containing protein 4-like protein [Leptotrombidium deliense]
MGEIEEARRILADAHQAVLTSTEEMKTQLFEELQVAETTTMEQGNDDYVSIPLLTEHMRTPGFNSSLQIRTNEEKGRYVITNKDMKKGTMVISENAVGFWLAPCRYELCCNFCMKILAKRYVSCRNCKAVRYCSLFCENNAWTQYHSIECPHLDILKYFSTHQTTLRFVIRFGFNAILETIAEGEMPLEFFCENGMQDNYRSLYSMFGHDQDLAFGNLFGYCIGSLLLTRVAEVMQLIERDSDEYYTLAAILLKQMFQINTNCFALTNANFTYLRDFNILVDHGDYTKNGIGVFLSSALLSHSCDYNCDRYTLGNQLVVVLNRDIKAGEEISITYGPFYKTMSIKDRQAYLQRNYHFLCNCHACANKLENVHFAYKCPQCSDFSEISMDILEQKIARVKDYFAEAQMLMNQNYVDAAGKCLDNALTVTKQINYSFISHYQMYIQCLHMSLIFLEYFGRDSVEAASYMISAASMLMLHTISNRSSSTASQVSTARSLFTAALNILNEVKGREMNVMSQYYVGIFRLIPSLNRMLQN